MPHGTRPGCVLQQGAEGGEWPPPPALRGRTAPHAPPCSTTSDLCWLHRLPHQPQLWSRNPHGRTQPPGQPFARPLCTPRTPRLPPRSASPHPSTPQTAPFCPWPGPPEGPRSRMRGAAAGPHHAHLCSVAEGPGPARPVSPFSLRPWLSPCRPWTISLVFSGSVLRLLRAQFRFIPGAP